MKRRSGYRSPGYWKNTRGIPNFDTDAVAFFFNKAVEEELLHPQAKVKHWTKDMGEEKLKEMFPDK